MQSLFELGNSISVDPKTRKVTHIDGVPVKDHTAEMQAFADAALDDWMAPEEAEIMFGSTAPRPDSDDI